MRECMCLCERAREREKEWMKRVRNRLGNEGERDRVHRNDSCSFSSFLLHKSFLNRVILTHKSFKSISGRYPLKRFSGKLNKPFQKKNQQLRVDYRCKAHFSWEYLDHPRLKRIDFLYLVITALGFLYIKCLWPPFILTLNIISIQYLAVLQSSQQNVFFIIFLSFALQV